MPVPYAGLSTGGYSKVNFHIWLTGAFVCCSAKKAIKVYSTALRHREWNGTDLGNDLEWPSQQSRLKKTKNKLSFMWLIWPCFSRRCQRGTAVRLGSLWQTIPGPGAISSCFLSQRPSLEVDCSYPFPLLWDWHERQDVCVFVALFFLIYIFVCLSWLAFRNQKTPSENQSSFCVFDAGPKWSWTEGISWFLWLH